MVFVWKLFLVYPRTTGKRYISLFKKHKLNNPIYQFLKCENELILSVLFCLDDMHFRTQNRVVNKKKIIQLLCDLRRGIGEQLGKLRWYFRFFQLQSPATVPNELEAMSCSSELCVPLGAHTQ